MDPLTHIALLGTITGSAVVRVGSNTSVIGKSGSGKCHLRLFSNYQYAYALFLALNGIGLRVLEESNVIIRNVKISKVLASVGDALGIQSAHQVWVDHVDLSSDRDHDKDL